MANWLTIPCNAIINAVRGVAVLIGDKLAYQEPYEAIDFEDDDLISKRGVLGLIPAVEEDIIFLIPVNSDGHYDYDYDGTLGQTPSALLQIAITDPSAGWATIGQGDLLNNGHIYVRADFSIDSYRLLIKP